MPCTNRAFSAELALRNAGFDPAKVRVACGFRVAMGRKTDRIEHRPGVTAAEFSLFCWLRCNEKVAESYGIKNCNGETTIGSMLLQSLRSQGMDVDWYERLPDGAIHDNSTNGTQGDSPGAPR